MAGPDLTSLAAEEGVVTPAGTAAYVDPNDLPVYTGRRPVLKPLGKKTIGRLTPFIGVQDSTSTTSQMAKELYAKDPGELRELQKRLYAAGFYGTYDVDKIVLGVPDEVTFEAYSTAVQRAGAYYAAGKKKTVDDVIDESAGILDQIYGKGGRRGGSGDGDGSQKRAPLTIGLTSPDDLRAVAQKTATGTIGRALTDSELAQFVASFHQAQASSQTASYNADVTGGTVTDVTDPGVAAENFARQQAPVEAGGSDFLRTFTAFRNILTRGGTT